MKKKEEKRHLDNTVQEAQRFDVINSVEMD